MAEKKIFNGNSTEKKPSSPICKQNTGPKFKHNFVQDFEMIRVF